ncbi:MAG: hexose kinase [Planctomycetota bacterium]
MKTSPRVMTITPNCAVDRTLSVSAFAPGRTCKATLLSRSPAGKGVNVSKVLARLGVPSIAAGFVGSCDARTYRDDLDALGVTSAFIPVPAPTRTNTTVIDPSRSTITHLREEGAPVARAALAALCSLVRDRARSCDFVVLCGSLPPGFPLTTLRKIVRAARSAGSRVVVDLEGHLLRALRNERLFLASPNVHELSDLAGRPLRSAAAIAAAAIEQRRYFESLLVSWGSRGAFLATGRDVLSARFAGRVRVRNTVGCGDALLAGLLAALLADASPSDALANAVAVATAAAATLTAGTFDRKVYASARRAVRPGVLEPS